MKKFVGMLFIALTVVSFGFAQVSGLSLGSASTVRDNTAYVMDVLDWNKADFGKFFGFTSIDSSSSLNFLGAQQVKGGNLAYSYAGNLWKEGSDNYSVFYGKKNMGFLFTLDADKAKEGKIESDMGDVNVENYGVFSPSFTFGMNATDKFSFKAGFGIGLTTGKNSYEIGTTEYLTKTSLSAPVVELAGYYTIKNTDKLFARLGLSYTGVFAGLKSKLYIDGEFDEKTELSLNANAIALSGSLEYKATDRFTYGLNAVFPGFVFNGGKDQNGDAIPFENMITFAISNGFVAEVSPDRFLLSFGMTTALPSFIFVEDEDTEITDIVNTYYLGMGFCLTPQIRIDGTATITPQSGISMKTIWEQKLAISVSIKL